MSPSTLILCLLVGTSWAYIPDDSDFRGDVFAGRQRAFAGSSDNAEQVVQKFLARMTRSLESKDVAVISGLFQPGFVFKGCKGTYDKTQIIGLLSRLPAGTQFTLTLKSALDTGSSIKYTVVASGFGPASIEANFVLNKADQQLESGEIPACQKSRFYRSVQDPAEDMVKRFLARVTRSIESKDTSIILGLFQPGFIFKGCKGTYNKQQVVGMLSKIPAGTKFSFALKSAVSLGNSIKYVVAVSGISATPIEAVFMLNKVDQQLEYGNILDCPKRFLRSAQPEDSNASLESALNNPDAEMVKRFLARITRSIESKDTSVLLGLFQPGFVFKGCKGTYNKQQVVGMLSKIPAGAKFSFDLKYAIPIDNSINYVVAVSGISAKPIEAVFMLNKVDQQLESGHILDCPKRFLRSAQPEDSNAVIQRFLTSMKPILASHDVAQIDKLFDDAFLFKGCHGTYTKAQAVAKIASLPAGASFDFSLINSKWNNLGQIEYTVYVSVPRMDRIQAQFVYCPQRNVLKSGSVPGCPARRFY
ncbi:unnamed protein product [Caenorhabditis nigoni]